VDSYSVFKPGGNILPVKYLTERADTAKKVKGEG